MSTTTTVHRTAAEPPRPDDAPRDWRGVLAATWREVRPENRPQRVVAVAGLALAAAGVAHLGVLAVDGGGWDGPVSWRKPIVFGVSLGILLVTVGAVLRMLPGSRAQWWVAGPLAVAAVVEYVAIASQRWRGVPSHFNEATPYDSAMFGIMAWSVGVIVLAVALLTLWVALPLRGRRGFQGGAALRLAVLVGLAALLLSSWVGGRMIAVGTDVVATTGAVPDGVVFGAQGSAKLFHATGQHGLQVLLGIALLLGVTGAPARRALAITAVASLGYLGVLAGVGASALRGESWLSFPPSLLLPAVPGALLVAVAGVLALARLRPAPPVPLRPEAAPLASRERGVVG